MTRLSTLAASVENVSTLLRMPPSTENMTLGRVGLDTLESTAGGLALEGAGADGRSGCAGDAGEAALLA